MSLSRSIGQQILDPTTRTLLTWETPPTPPPSPPPPLSNIYPSSLSTHMMDDTDPKHKKSEHGISFFLFGYKNKSQTQNKTKLAHLSHIICHQNRKDPRQLMPQQNKPMMPPPPHKPHLSLSLSLSFFFFFFFFSSNDLVHLLYHGILCACYQNRQTYGTSSFMFF
jgi:hypothetical protein